MLERVAKPAAHKPTPAFSSNPCSRLASRMDKQSVKNAMVSCKQARMENRKAHQ
jgi:hypothetical protein